MSDKTLTLEKIKKQICHNCCWSDLGRDKCTTGKDGINCKLLWNAGVNFEQAQAPLLAQLAAKDEEIERLKENFSDKGLSRYYELLLDGQRNSAVEVLKEIEKESVALKLKLAEVNKKYGRALVALDDSITRLCDAGDSCGGCYYDKIKCFDRLNDDNDFRDIPLDDAFFSNDELFNEKGELL